MCSSCYSTEEENVQPLIKKTRCTVRRQHSDVANNVIKLKNREVAQRTAKSSLFESKGVDDDVTMIMIAMMTPPRLASVSRE